MDIAATVHIHREHLRHRHLLAAARRGPPRPAATPPRPAATPPRLRRGSGALWCGK
ncbi:hypothetical protein ACIQCJ_03495 [Streptomyces sp. NPDC093221]|uniref:hypothetical protein n=1 Tax=Streptomyces sp. NPDC093221 TaxID=3366032 RepID=UPI0037F674DB